MPEFERREVVTLAQYIRYDCRQLSDDGVAPDQHTTRLTFDPRIQRPIVWVEWKPPFLHDRVKTSTILYTPNDAGKVLLPETYALRHPDFFEALERDTVSEERLREADIDLETLWVPKSINDHSISQSLIADRRKLRAIYGLFGLQDLLQ